MCPDGSLSVANPEVLTNRGYKNCLMSLNTDSCF